MARVTMLAMYRDGVIALPPPKGRQGRPKPIVFGPDTEPPLFPAPTALDAVRPLEVRIDHGSRHPLPQLRDTRDTLRRDHAELRELTPSRVDRLRALAHQEITGTKQHRTRLRFLHLDRHEPHCRTLRRLDDRFRIVRVILLALQERFDIDRRNQLAHMTKSDDLPTPVMRTAAGLHHNLAWRLKAAL